MKKTTANLQNKGITLIALVVTIIVLLILAGVTMTLVMGENGLISRAQESGKNYVESETKEREDLAKLNNEYDQIVGSSNREEKTGISKTTLYDEGISTTGIVTLSDNIMISVQWRAPNAEKKELNKANIFMILIP